MRYTYTCYPVPTPPFPFPTITPKDGHRFPFPSIPSSISWASSLTATNVLCGKQKALAGRSSVCYNVPTEAGGGFVAVLSFFAFIALAGTGTLTLGYVLSSLEKQMVGRRCRVPHQTHRRKAVRRQRVRCRHDV